MLCYRTNIVLLIHKYSESKQVYMKDNWWIMCSLCVFIFYVLRKRLEAFEQMISTKYITYWFYFFPQSNHPSSQNMPWIIHFTHFQGGTQIFYITTCDFVMGLLNRCNTLSWYNGWLISSVIHSLVKSNLGKGPSDWKKKKLS